MKIATLTLNPALDKSTYTERILPEKKIRCQAPDFEPGGGGINVSRAIKIMGGESLTIYAAGGNAGDKIYELLTKDELTQQRITTQNPTRENFMVMEKQTGEHFRFGMPGFEMSEKEQKLCFEAVENLPSDVEYLVASGSLPPGVSADFYARIAVLTRKKNIKCFVDTSGEALELAAKEGLCLMKPNLRELSILSGKEHISGLEQEEIARRIIHEGKAQMLIVSLGNRGAMLATKDRIEYVVPPTVQKKSTVGAGDSMVGAIVLSMSRGEDISTALRWGVAAGTAATMTSGTELCRKSDVEEIFRWITEHNAGWHD